MLIEDIIVFLLVVPATYLSILQLVVVVVVVVVMVVVVVVVVVKVMVVCEAGYGWLLFPVCQS